MHPSPFILDIDVDTLLDIPIFEFDLKFVFTDSCVITDIWIDLMFGHHMEGIEVDYGADQTNEWEFKDPGYGYYGFQNSFYDGEFNDISQSSDTSKLSIDAITGTTVDGFFLLPKGSIVEYFDLQFYNNDISNVNNTNEGFQLSLVLGANSNLISLTTSSNRLLC